MKTKRFARESRERRRREKVLPANHAKERESRTRKEKYLPTKDTKLTKGKRIEDFARESRERTRIGRARRILSISVFSVIRGR
jgi:hypothetical protein